MAKVGSVAEHEHLQQYAVRTYVMWESANSQAPNTNRISMNTGIKYLRSITMCYHSLPGATRSGSVLPGHYQCLPGRATIPKQPSGVHVSAPTKPYQTLPGDRSGPTPAAGHFTRTPPPWGDITHSDDTMCYAGLLRLYGCGYDRHLYDVGILLVWLDTVINECLGLTDGMEVGRV